MLKYPINAHDIKKEAKKHKSIILLMNQPFDISCHAFYDFILMKPHFESNKNNFKIHL